MAIKLLVKGMPLRGVAEVLEVKLDTVRHWLKVAAEQSEKIDALLMKELKVSQVELDALWSFVKKTRFARERFFGGRSLDRRCLCQRISPDAFLHDRWSGTLSAAPLVDRTEERLRKGSWPVLVSDGMDAYGEALKGRHCILKIYPRTGKRGRPRRDKLVVCPELRYGQVVKERDERHRVIGVFKRCRYGDIPLHKMSTVYIERHNLTLRHENRRLTRKTIAFSKNVEGLWDQLFLYQGYYNFVRPHRGLKRRIPAGRQTLQKWQRRTPALAAKLTDHVWSLKEFMTKRTFIND